MTCFVASEQRKARIGGGGGRSRVGFGRQRELQGDVGIALQHSPRQEAMKRVGTGRLEGDGEPLSTLQTHAHVQTLSHKLTGAHHKSLSLTGVWFWIAASCNPSTQLLNVACCNFSSSARATHVLSTDITLNYIYTPERSWIRRNERHGYKLRHFYRHPVSAPISSLTAPWVFLIFFY